MLLLLLSHFSRVRLCATPQTAAHQAPPSLGFSRQEHWSGLPSPSPMHESEKWKWSRSVVSDLRDPMDCSLPGSSVHGIFQARVLEWGAIAFSETYSRSQYFLSFFSAVFLLYCWNFKLLTPHFNLLEKEMATHPSVLAWRIPGTGDPGGLLSMGSHRVRHDWSNLAAAAADWYKVDN